MTQRRDDDGMQEELEELFADLWQVPGFVGRRRGFRPHIDCFRTEDPPAVTMIVELAGVDPDEIDIQVSERAITISGTRRRPAHECRVSYQQMEIEYGQFQRRFSLSENVDPEQAEARYERGLLTLVLPLAPKPRVGRVTITFGERRRQA
jgi:HSP20 family molecular chaperone IbpA